MQQFTKFLTRTVTRNTYGLLIQAITVFIVYKHGVGIRETVWVGVWSWVWFGNEELA